MAYVDGFVLSLPKKNLAAYKALSRKAGKVGMDHGALSGIRARILEEPVIYLKNR